jgi:hypothetical protein
MGPASLRARAPMTEARLTGWQLRHEGVKAAMEGAVESARGGGVSEDDSL